MRIYFKNRGFAEYYLKVGKRLLQEAHSIPEGERFPFQLTRNAFCKAFGYRSYNELSRVVQPGGASSHQVPSEDDVRHAYALGFFLALGVPGSGNCDFMEMLRRSHFTLPMKLWRSFRMLGRMAQMERQPAT